VELLARISMMKSTDVGEIFFAFRKFVHPGILSFDDGHDTVQELVPDGIEDGHLVLSLRDLSDEVGLALGVVCALSPELRFNRSSSA
jgi:hypothetical protein